MALLRFYVFYVFYFQAEKTQTGQLCNVGNAAEMSPFSMHFAYFDQLRQFWVRNPQRITPTAAEERGRWRETGDGELVFQLRV